MNIWSPPYILVARIQVYKQRKVNYVIAQWARMAFFTHSLGNVHSLVDRGLKCVTTLSDHQIDVVLRQEDQKLSNVGRKRPKIAKKQ